MTTAHFIRRTDGAYVPYTDQDKESLGRVKFGEVIRCDFKRPRNPGHHRKAFALLNAMFENQDMTENFDQFYDWVKAKAGLFEPVFGVEGFFKLKSLSYSSMGQEDFDKVYQKIITVAVEELGQEWALTFS